MEDDPLGSITTGPGSKFEFEDRPEPGTAKPRLKDSEEGGDSVGDDDDDDGGDDRGGFGDDDIEDGWADLLVLDSNPVSGRSKDGSPSPPSSNVPPLAKSRPVPASSAAKSTSIPRVKTISKKEQPVPILGVVIPKSSSSQVADEGASTTTSTTTTSPDVVVGRSRQSSATRVIRQQQQQQQQPGYRMHTARARDGGRTQSGGVKGVSFTDPSSS